MVERGISPFLRIPGGSEEHSTSTVLVDNAPYPIAELHCLLSSSDPRLHMATLSALRERSDFSSSEILLASTVLFSYRTTVAEAETALIDLLSNHLNEPEAINIGAQLTRIWQTTEVLAESRQNFINTLVDLIHAIRFPPTALPHQEIVAKRYILLRAFESSSLRAAAHHAIRSILEDQNPVLTIARKAFSGQLLAAARSFSHAPELIPLKQLASTVFALGAVPTIGMGTTDTLGTKNQSPDAPPSAAPKAQELVTRLVCGNEPDLISRLLPQDFQILQQVKGLDLDSFRIISDKLRAPAVSDPWARAAILDLVRSRHQPEVSSRIRTAVLGAFVSEARKYGKLTRQLEKEVFAISAEIPTLPFLHNESRAIEPDSASVD